MEILTEKQKSDLALLGRFIQIYCKSKHGNFVTGKKISEILGFDLKRDGCLCPDCSGLLEHGIVKRRLCPLEPKPTCRACHIHCYSAQYKEKIREIMAFSGRKMILRGRIDYLWHYFVKK